MGPILSNNKDEPRDTEQNQEVIEYIESVQDCAMETSSCSSGSCASSSSLDSLSSVATLGADSSATMQDIPDIREITLEKLQYVEETLLDLSEKVSLVYLLYDDCDDALNEIKRLVSNVPNIYPIQKWIEFHIKLKTKNWQRKLLEAMSVIQDYRVLRIFGCDKQCAIDTYLPLRGFTAQHISILRKALYLILDNLSSLEVKEFLLYAKKDFANKKLTYKEYDENFLEMQFLFFEREGYASQNNLINIIHILQRMSKNEFCDSLSKINGDFTIPKGKMVSNDIFQRKVVEDNCGTTPRNLLVEDNIEPMQSDDDKYFMNKREPGLVLIINQQYFYKEFDQNNRHLVGDLDDRHGTEFDGQELQRTFSFCGFEDRSIIYLENRTHSQILHDIEDTCKKVKEHTSLFICILSHGENGYAYGSDSVKVPIKEIERIVQNTNTENLEGKPKILIYQLCRKDGNENPSNKAAPEKYNLDFESDIEFDAPSHPVTKYADFCTFWATVSGFSAVRDIKRGTWFIQQLCFFLKQKAGSDHFQDICTYITDQIFKRCATVKGEEIKMIPEKTSTLRKKLYFPISGK